MKPYVVRYETPTETGVHGSFSSEDEARKAMGVCADWFANQKATITLEGPDVNETMEAPQTPKAPTPKEQAAAKAKKTVSKEEAKSDVHNQGSGKKDDVLGGRPAGHQGPVRPDASGPAHR
jgi:hypothetical protein